MARQKMITAEIARKLPKLNEADVKDPIVHLKLFNPVGAATWLITEYDGEDTFFGWADLGMGPGCAELGYISKSELEEVALPFGMYIERDAHFTPKLLSEAKKEISG